MEFPSLSYLTFTTDRNRVSQRSLSFFNPGRCHATSRDCFAPLFATVPEYNLSQRPQGFSTFSPQ
jgi:hypothetical protein